jgi:TonB-linked SusC/RagA family outer membrane protein
MLYAMTWIGSPIAQSSDVYAFIPQDKQQSSQILLADALRAIEESFNITFVYEADLVRGIQVSESVTKITEITEAFALLTEWTGLTVEQIGGRNFQLIADIKSASKKARMERISGTVYDASTRETLPGVNIILKGTTTGTSSDNEGFFELEVPSLYDTLQFSFIGFELLETPINGRRIIDAALEPQAVLGDELLVVGYGTQTKRDLTGSVGRVSTEEIEDATYLSADQALQGRLSGVQVIPFSGKPGDGVTVQVRGIGTINNSQPLFVVDGFPINGGLSAINVDDIESIDVLKDASASAIYGARGANGVVIITTKRGTAGKMEVSIEAYTGMQELENSIQVLSGAQLARLNNEARINGGENVLNPAYANPAEVGTKTDWLNQIFRKAAISNYGASVSGGTQKLRYNVSGGYLTQDGVIIASGFDRKSLRVNLDSEVSDLFEMGNSFTYSLSNFQNEGGGGLVGAAISALPTQAVIRYGTYSGPEGIAEFSGDVTNPVGLANVNESRENKHRLINNVYASLTPFESLEIRSEFGVDISYELNRSWNPKYSWGVSENPNSSVFESSFTRTDWIWDNTATFDTDIADHSITALAGISVQKSDNRFIGAFGQEFISDVANQLDNIQGDEEVFGSTSEFGLFSYIGRLNYGYQSKYLVTVTARYDGSSRFGSNNRYGLFPSASLAWRISQEPFMPQIEAISDIKLRVGHGVTGNQESIPAFGYIALLDPTYNYTFGNTTVPAIIPQNLPNDDLRWERVVQTNVGIDMILLNGSTDVTLEYYVRDTEDMLLVSPIPITSGYFDAQRPVLNVGEIRNKGVEFSLNTVQGNQHFQWSTSLNVSRNINEIQRLSGANGEDPIPTGQLTFSKFASRLQVGNPIGAFYGYETDGLFQNWDEVYAHADQNQDPENGRGYASSTRYTAPGDIRFVDQNNDGLINDADRTFIGNPNPDLYYGWTNSFNYKNFDVTVFIQGSYGGEIFNANRLFNESMTTAANQLSSTLDRWRGENTSEEVPRATTTDPNNNLRVSDRYIEDGSFLRIKNLTLGYTLPVSIAEKIGARQFRAYFSIQNLTTFTNYSGFDPEVGSSGIDNSVYPQSRTLTAGFKLAL